MAAPIDQFSISKTATSSGYHYEPNLALSGSNFFDVASTSQLQLSSKFSVASWFKTSSNYPSDAIVVIKGGFGSEIAGKNINYGIWLDSSERLKGGFETSSGVDMFSTSANTYSDGQWHYGVVTYDGSTVRLYVDGAQVATKSTTGTPDNSGTQPVRVGANFLTQDRFFIGNVDEVRVWNRALSSSEVANAFDGTFNTSGQVLFLPFSSSATSLKLSANEINSTNQTGSLQNFTNKQNITSPSGRSSSNNLVPVLPPVPNNTKTFENKVISGANDQKSNNLVPVLPPVPNNTKTFENKVISGANDQKSKSNNLVPVLPPVTILPEKDQKPKTKNIPPNADAGKNQVSIEGSEVILDGSNSKDKDGKINSYQWQQIAGPKMNVDNVNSAKADFISPLVTHDTILVFKLRVTDDKGGLDSAITTIKVVDKDQRLANIPDLPASNLKNKPDRGGNVTNSTAQ